MKKCDFCVIATNEDELKLGEVNGEELLKMKNGTYAIYNCWYRGEYSLLENVKFCPYCGRRLEEGEK